MIQDDDLHSSESPRREESPCEFRKHYERTGTGRAPLLRFIISITRENGESGEYNIEATDLIHAVTVAMKREHEKGYAPILAGLLAQRDNPQTNRPTGMGSGAQ